MARDGGFTGVVADQVAAMLEDEHRLEVEGAQIDRCVFCEQAGDFEDGLRCKLCVEQDDCIPF